MHFARTEEQDELAAARRGAAGQALSAPKPSGPPCRPPRATTPRSGRRCASRSASPRWRVPEEYDGFGASLVETAVVLELLGEFLTPAPLLASARSPPRHCSLARTEDAKRRLLPRIAAGEVATLVLGDGPVLDGDRARWCSRVATTGSSSCSGRHARSSAESMDQTLRLGYRPSDAVEVARGYDARPGPSVQRSTSRPGRSAACSGALDMTVAYSKERVQFGRTIGSFQALKHRMADMLVKVESSRRRSWGATAAAAAYLADPSA